MCKSRPTPTHLFGGYFVGRLEEDKSQLASGLQTSNHFGWLRICSGRKAQDI